MTINSYDDFIHGMAHLATFYRQATKRTPTCEELAKAEEIANDCHCYLIRKDAREKNEAMLIAKYPAPHYEIEQQCGLRIIKGGRQ